jgi:dTDP-4-dehydrorhamnose reductase
MIAHTSKTILVLGASGMLGSAVFRFLAYSPEYSTFGAIRSEAALTRLPAQVRSRTITGLDIENTDNLVRLFSKVRPNIVINCVGLVKQLAEVSDPLLALPINAMLPHRLAGLCEAFNARLIHVSTDCVFSGLRGGYVESDMPDGQDLYGRSKLLGEVDYPQAVTLRTSIIGHELASIHGLVEWFLAQENTVKGYRQAVFSGLPTVELARIIRDYVLPYPKLRGVYHVSATPINKFDLLKLIALVYHRENEIIPDDEVRVDRSLNSSRFRTETNYEPDDWPLMIERMFAFQAEAHS